MPVPPPVIAVVPLAGSEAAVTCSVSPGSGAAGWLGRASTGGGGGCRIALAVAVGDRVGEGVRSGEVGLGRVADEVIGVVQRGRVRLDEGRAVRRVRDRGDLQVIQV